MKSEYLPIVSVQAISSAKASGNMEEMYDALVQPLHEELYRQRTFEFIDSLSDGQQLLLAYDYMRMQVGQGGFIQFIQNGYIGLLPSMIEQLYTLNLPAMAKVLDDVLKVYVLNRDLLNKQTTVEEFAKLYDELKEFELIDDQFNQLNEQTIRQILDYAYSHLDEFVTAVM